MSEPQTAMPPPPAPVTMSDQIRDLPDGGTVFFPKASVSSVRSIVSRMGAETGRMFITRVRTEGEGKGRVKGIRVWRVG